MNFNAVVRILGAQQDGVKWQANCPAHDDTEFSLAITKSGENALIVCAKDCSYPEITERIESLIGISTADKNSKKKLASGAFTSMKDLLAEPEEVDSWLVGDFLQKAGVGLLAGKPKAGKSTLARQLALAVARGESFLGRGTKKGQVLYLALEEKRGEVAKHFKAMGAGDDCVHVFIGTVPEEGLAWARESAIHHKASLIVIDPMAFFLRVRDMSDYAQVTRAFEPIIRLARDTGCS